MAKRSAQENFFHKLGEATRARREHGGDITQGKRKKRRPLDKKKALHVVMRASKARKAMSFRASPQRAKQIDAIIAKQSKRFGVKIEQSGNAGNHIHLLVRFQERGGFQNFLRAVTGLIARFITNAHKGKAKEKFWDKLAYSRVVECGRDFGHTRRYVELNDVEGACGSSARAHFADEWAQRPWWVAPQTSDFK